MLSKHFTSKLNLLFVLVSMAASCSKKDAQSPTPNNTPGSVSGSFTPPTAATAVSLDTITGSPKYTELPATDGSFRFSSVIPGRYLLRITQTPVYNAPSQPLVVVNSGTNTVVPLITLNYNSAAQTGTMGFNINSSAYSVTSGDIYLTYASSLFHLTGKSTGSSGYYTISLKFAGVSGTGNYSTTTPGSSVTITYYSSPGFAGGTWSTDSGGSAGISITTLDPATRKASGTFSGTLSPQGSATGTKLINGSFSNVVY